MSENDHFFDAWVRDKLHHTEAPAPEHLWNEIRKRSQTYLIMERNKYLFILLLLLGATSGTGYWAFHTRVEKAAVISAGIKASNGVAAGVIASGVTASGVTASGVAASGIAVSGVAASGIAVSGVTASGIAASGVTASDIAASGIPPQGTAVPEAGPAARDITEAGLTAPALYKTTVNSNIGSPIDLPGAGLPGTAMFLLTPVLPVTLPNADVSTAGLIYVHPRRHTYLEIYAGPDHVDQYITTSNKAFDEYVAQKRDAETSYPSFSLGLRLDIPLAGDDWRLQSGVHYAQINEKMEYSNFNAVKTLMEVSSRYMVQPNGTTVLVKDTSTVSVKGQFLKQSLNAYRMIDIPVIVSHTLFKTGQVQVNGSGGALFNVTSWYDGDILDTNNIPVAIQTKTTQGASAWKKHIGTSLYGSLSLYDQVFSRVQATFEPYLRYDLSTVNKDVSIYRERFVTTGLMVGIRYQLGK